MALGKDKRAKKPLGQKTPGPKNPWAKKPLTFFVVSSHEICQGFFGPTKRAKKPLGQKTPDLGQKTRVMKRSH